MPFFICERRFLYTFCCSEIERKEFKNSFCAAIVASLSADNALYLLKSPSLHAFSAPRVSFFILVLNCAFFSCASLAFSASFCLASISRRSLFSKAVSALSVLARSFSASLSLRICSISSCFACLHMASICLLASALFRLSSLSKALFALAILLEVLICSAFDISGSFILSITFCPFAFNCCILALAESSPLPNPSI